MNVFVKVDKRAPIVTQQLWYHVGSADERSGATGLAHLLEHMMFNGTKKYPSEYISNAVSKVGGSSNAFTSYDFTTYFETLPVAHLETVMMLEADRMKNLKITPDSFKKELAVVREERRLRTTDSPQAKFYENFFNASFMNSGYRNPVIGWDEDLVKLTPEVTNEWYERWYAPNNVSLVIVGDVDPKKILRLARKHFGSIKPQPSQSRELPTEPPLDHRVEISMQAKNVSPLLLMAYKVPSYVVNPDDSLALTLLSMILSNGESDWLVKKLVFDKKIALNVDVSYSLEDRGTTLLSISATPVSGVSMEKLESEIVALIRNIPSNIYTKKTISKMYNQLKSQRIFSQDSIFYQGMQIGLPQSLGLSWKIYQELPERLKAIKPKALKAVAKKYLDTNSYIIGTLTPE